MFAVADKGGALKDLGNTDKMLGNWRPCAPPPNFT